MSMRASNIALWCLISLVSWLAASVAMGAQWGMRIADPPSGAGALVTAVTRGGAAEQAGLQAGDLITHAEGRKVLKAGDLAVLLKSLPDGQGVNLSVSRQGWEKGVTLRADPGDPVAGHDRREGPAPGAYPPGESHGALKATIAVGDFQVKAARANQYIGDGLREMLLTALHNTGRFIVVERIDIKGLVAEQALSRSEMAKPEMAIPGAGMDVADVIVYGAVTEFEGDASGSEFQMSVPSLPFSAGRGGKTSHMAIDMRAVDVRTGRLLMAQRIASSADSSKGSFSASPTLRGQSLPFSFGSFRNTPMEKAIREAVMQATHYLSTNLPPAYFRHP